MSFENDIHKYAEQPLTSQLLMDLLREYYRPYDKINELVKKKTLIKIRRGPHLAPECQLIVLTQKFGV